MQIVSLPAAGLAGRGDDLLRPRVHRGLGRMTWLWGVTAGFTVLVCCVAGTLAVLEQDWSELVWVLLVAAWVWIAYQWSVMAKTSRHRAEVWERLADEQLQRRITDAHRWLY